MNKPRIAVTLGDAAGIGPELVLRACRDARLAGECDLVVYGCRALLDRVSRASGIPMPEAFSFSGGAASGGAAGPVCRLVEIPFPEAGGIEPGRAQAACGRQAAAWIRAAAGDVRRGAADALVTAPICKDALRLAGIPFPGHTEMLAALTGAKAPCMAFSSPRLLISLATIHAALRDVPGMLAPGPLLRTIRLTHDACARRKGAKPRVGVLALNPHAGENGLFGDEEERVIRPAVERARAEGLDVEGPLVPDTAFTWLPGGGPAPFDGYVAMYHDQALILFKTFAFRSGVNVTLGLPIVRTSPDHGTAFDRAWKGTASPDSLISAVRLAVRLSAGR